MSATLPVLAAAGANAALALLLLFGLGLLGNALVPARLRPVASVTRFATSLSVGTAVFGWTTWVLGSLAGTKALPFLWLALVDNDGIRYHVALPKLYLLTGKVFLYPWDVTGAYPQLGNMLYLAGLVAGSVETAKFLNAGFLAASCGVLALTLHRSRLSRRAALAGPLLFLACPVVGVVAGTGFIDHIALFHLVTALALVQRKGPPLLTGLALGASLATKLTLAPGAVALGLASKEEYLGRTIPGYRAAAYVNELPPGEVMAGDFPGPVYFDRPWIVEGLINEAPLTLWIRNGETADRPLARLHENGIRWLLATPAFGGGTPLSLLTYAPDPSKAHVMAALRSRLRFVATVDRVDVWEVPAPSRSGKP